MFLKSITIEGVAGDVEIARTGNGALVTLGNRVVCEVRRNEDREDRFAKTVEVAKLVFGTDQKGRPNATNSMVYDVWQEIDRVAVC